MPLFSPSTKGFYVSGLNDPATIPLDAVLVTDAERDAISAAFAAGKVISVGGDGKPVPVDNIPDPAVVKLNLSLPKWKVYKAMTQLKIDGTARGSGETGAWPTVRAAMFGLNSEVQGEWDAMSEVPRSETKWSYFYDGVMVVKSGNATLANAFIDAVFAKAATYP